MAILTKIHTNFVCLNPEPIILYLMTSSLPSPASSLLPDHLQLLLLNVGLARHQGDWNWQEVNSPFIRIYYVIDGSAALRLPQGTVPLTPGHLYFVPAFTTHDCQCDGTFTHYYIHAYEEQYPVSSLIDNFTLPTEIEATGLDRQLFDRLIELNPSMTLPQSNPCSYDNKHTLIESVHRNKMRSPGIRLESRGILYQLLARFLAHGVPRAVATDPRISKALNYIAQHLDTPISIPALASDACLSDDHFIRLFRSQVGEPPLRYIIRKKVERAQLLLLTDTQAVKSIAYGLGFDDFSYFTRLFRKYTDLSPQAYRKKYTKQ